MSTSTITYLDADETIRDYIKKEWGEKAAAHMHLTDGFSIVAFQNNLLVGLISAYRKKLPPPLIEHFDLYIHILEVHNKYRRRGIATELINMVCERAKTAGMYQVRSWSSQDKIEAIAMWKALGFGFCPAVTYPEGNEVKGYFVAKVL